MRTTMHARRAAAALLGLVAITAIATTSCEESPRGSILAPTGGAGTTFQSRFTFLQIVGDFNGFNAGVPSMSLNEGGLWADTLTIQPGCYLMKVRTENDWDETPDFGRCSGSEGDCLAPVPGDGTVYAEDVCEVTGQGTAIGQIEFLETGSYEFVLDEPLEELRIRKLTETGSITGVVTFASLRGMPVATVTVLDAGTSNEVTSVQSDATDGSFLVEGLTPGTYDVSVFSTGFQEELFEGVSVAAFETVDLGTIELAVGCTSAFSVIRLVGDFNGFDATVPSMTEIEPCLWVDTLLVNPPNPADACAFFKFRTGSDWGANDYGGCAPEDGTCPGTVALTGSVCVGAGGDPPAIGKVELQLGATYEVTLDEAALTYRVRRLDVATGTVSGVVAFSDSPGTLPAATIRVVPAGGGAAVATGTSSVADGSFTVADVPVGTWDVVVEAEDYGPETVAGVTVIGDTDTDVGTVTLDPLLLGSISGVIAFSDSPSPRPAATVTVLEAGTTTEVANTTSSTADGSFSVAGVAGGTYDLRVTAGGYVTRTVTGVAVAPPADTDAGTITLTKLGAIAGTIAFSDNPPSRPSAIVTVLLAGTNTPVRSGASSPTDGTFAVGSIASGTYDVRFTADGYLTELVTGVSVTPPDTVSLGTVTMELRCSTSIQIVGDFNSWNSFADSMSVAGPCAWADTLAIPAGCHRLKLRTNGNWDTTPDYGSCDGNVLPCRYSIPGTGAPIIERLCRGSGLKDAFGEVQFPVTGNYEFQFDEARGLLFMRLLP